MKSKFVIAAFYYGAHYELCARKLIYDCEKFGYDYEITSPPDLEKFVNNKLDGVTMWRWICRYKPTFIYNTLKKYNKPVIYLDVDCKISEKINFRVMRKYKIGISHEKNLNKGSWIFDTIVSCIVFKPDEVIYDFLKLWEFKCRTVPIDDADHYFFKTTLRDYSAYKKMRIGYLDGKKPFAHKNRKLLPTIVVDARQFHYK